MSHEDQPPLQDFQLFQIDAQGRLFISPDVDDLADPEHADHTARWQLISTHEITVIFDVADDEDNLENWRKITPQKKIREILDVNTDLTMSISQTSDELIYIYFPFEDKEDLPDLAKLHLVARFGATLIQNGHKVLSHCLMGHNRSALLAGVILTYLGMDGNEAVTLIRQKRNGALYNKVYAEYLEQLKKEGS